MRALDLAGKTFGEITVLSRAENTKCGKTQWLCRCSCGKEWIVQAGNLKKIKTCRECSFRNPHKKHGDYGTRLYNIYMGMRNRCENKNNSSYSHYGGRGIYVCSDWQDFNAFKEWALANGYDDAKSIERIDVNGNYEPNNCTWIEMREQRHNTRVSRKFTLNGKTQDLALWAKEYGVNYYTLYSRIERGIDIETALTM